MQSLLRIRVAHAVRCSQQGRSRVLTLRVRRSLSTSRIAHRTLQTESDIDEFLSKPTWSVEALLPTERQIEETTEVSPKQLRHLLRLSALPPPATAEEETEMLRDLKAQLHFVKDIQKVDTAGVEPLRSIRDETAEAEKESEIGLEALKEALAEEEIVGKHHKRIRRKQGVAVDTAGIEDWDVLGQASNKVGKYFVVHGGGGEP